jgi:hypothetical protein
MMFDLTTPDGRRAAAFAAILGGCFTMTVFAAFGVYIVRKDAGLSFWLALAAHAQITLGLSAFTALFVKRSISVGKDGVTIEDKQKGDK